MIEIDPIIEEDPQSRSQCRCATFRRLRASRKLGWQPQIGIDAGLRVIL